MKNLKKVFSLVLVLVMACGLFATASATSFTDDADINYTDAVDVLSGIGILEGYPDGTFKPQGNVTRAAAAKMISYLLIGKTSAEALTKDVSPFTDVPAGHWAAGYIQYCANQGILNGVGDGKFNPNGNVTNAQFAKMLLSALGYGVNGEFVGSKWKTEVTKYAVRAKIFNGNYAANPDAAANREQAALYTFNAMTADKVNYSALFGDYLTNVGLNSDDKIGTFAETYGLGSVVGTLDFAGGFIVTDGKSTVIGIDANSEDIGRAGIVWYQTNAKGEKVAVTGVNFIDNVLATKYNGAGMKAWSTQGTPNYVAPKAANVTYYVDGVLADAEPTFNKGDKVSLIDTNADNAIDLVIVTTYESAITLKTVPTVKNDKVSIGGKSYEAKKVVGLENLAAGDVIYLNNNYRTGITYINKAVAVSGQKTAEKGTSIIFGGVAYTGINSTVTSEMLGLDFNTDGTLYLGSGGYVIKAINTQPAAALNYAIIANPQRVTTSGYNQSAALMATLVYSDGTTEVVTIAKVDGNKTTDAKAVTEGVWYSYVVNEDGTVNVSIVKDSKNINAGKVSAKAKFDGTLISNAKTTFVVKTMVQGAPKYTVYTGYTALPTINATAGNVVLNINGVVALAYIDGSLVAAPAQQQTAYILSTLPTTVFENNVRVYKYSAIVDGELTTLTAEANQDLKEIGLYEIEIDNGLTTIGELQMNIEITEEFTLVAADGIIYIGSNVYMYNNNTVVYFYDSINEELTTGTVEDLGAYDVGNIAYEYAVKADGTVDTDTVAAIYVIQ